VKRASIVIFNTYYVSFLKNTFNSMSLYLSLKNKRLHTYTVKLRGIIFNKDIYILTTEFDTFINTN